MGAVQSMIGRRRSVLAEEEATRVSSSSELVGTPNGSRPSVEKRKQHICVLSPTISPYAYDPGDTVARFLFGKRATASVSISTELVCGAG